MGPGDTNGPSPTQWTNLILKPLVRNTAVLFPHRSRGCFHAAEPPSLPQADLGPGEHSLSWGFSDECPTPTRSQG